MQRKYSLRKLSIGLASVAIGIGIINGTGQSVKADTAKNTSTNGLVTPRNDVNSTAASQNIKEDPSQVRGVTSKQDKAPLHVESNNFKSDATQSKNEAKPESQIKNAQQDFVPKTQEVNDGSNLDAEKSIVRTSSLQEPDNQSNNHAKNNSQPQTSQKLDLTKNSPKFAKKVLATNLTQDDSTQNNDWADPARGIDPVKFASNGGFDPKIWGTMDTSKWQLDNDGNITGYTGDMSHIIIPNASDFAKPTIMLNISKHRC